MISPRRNSESNLFLRVFNRFGLKLPRSAPNSIQFNPRTINTNNSQNKMANSVLRQYHFSKRFVVILVVLIIMLVSLLWNTILLFRAACFNPQHSFPDAPLPIISEQPDTIQFALPSTAPPIIIENIVTDQQQEQLTDIAKVHIPLAPAPQVAKVIDNQQELSNRIPTPITTDHHEQQQQQQQQLQPPSQQKENSVASLLVEPNAYQTFLPSTTAAATQYPSLYSPSSKQTPVYPILFSHPNAPPLVVNSSIARSLLPVSSLRLSSDWTPIPNAYQTYLNRQELWSIPVPKPSTYRCAAQFGNAFSEKISLCNMNATRTNTILQPSTFTCYHNPVLFTTHCELTDFQLDSNFIYSAAQGGETIEQVRFQAEEDEYLLYKEGAFAFNCPQNDATYDIVKSPDKRRREIYFPNHLEKIAVAAKYETNLECDSYTDRPTILVTRYEFANLFHSLTLWYNIYQAINIFNLHEITNNTKTFKEVDIIFLDAHSASALDPIWTHLFRSVKYIRHEPVQRLCLKRAFIIAPGYRSGIGVAQMKRQLSRCAYSQLLEDFSTALLQAFRVKRLIEDPALNSELITATDSNHEVDQVEIRDIRDQLHTIKLDPHLKLAIFIVRRDYVAHPRAAASNSVQRQLRNEEEILEKCDSIFTSKGYKFLALDFARLTMFEQMTLFHYSSVVVSPHGAALAHIVISNPHVLIIELRPKDYFGRETFAFLSQWLNRYYAHFQIDKASTKDKIGHIVDAAIFEARVKRTFDDYLNGILPKSTDFRASEIEPRQMALPQLSVVNTDFILTPDKYIPKYIVAPYIQQEQAVTPIRNHRLNPQFLINKQLNARNNPISTSSSSSHKLCLLVPFRDSARTSNTNSNTPTSQSFNRTENLMQFLPAITKHLKSVQVTAFSIIVIEQYDDEILFNKGALFNAGFDLSLQLGYNCDYFILHDVDQVPESTENRYDYPARVPRHLCIATSGKNYKPAYSTMVGGALAINEQHYLQVNGYSNEYWGWGQEDDDFYFRLSHTFSNIDRLTPAQGRYRSLDHKRVKDLDATPIFRHGTKKLRLMANKQFNFQKDGLNTLKYDLFDEKPIVSQEVKAVKYTVKLKFDRMPKSLNDTDFLPDS